ncbi:P-loop containing nucleoside triphosphate hydrolase [Pseudocohnilembus persalinus]|uniref:p-loop containing nucleoside triphosphate hydrolase n=1 Tax=Pseudocohnilembus persalinus TaxID=266149 RepID=A0A0V0QNZ5_PSEPJ|nr:P-loop containing nucleoside triphosphate hydrolase [Pseudocohnilembus persalinus]|eukprot:KRX03963.1 P-loop containing nucleoside triphosphate hydrolase [Pseudocohnilembus persalinus]
MGNKLPFCNNQQQDKSLSFSQYRLTSGSRVTLGSFDKDEKFFQQKLKHILRHEPNFEIKLLFSGDKGVGKSHLIKKIRQKTFQNLDENQNTVKETEGPTQMMQFQRHCIEMFKRKVKVNLIDIPGGINNFLNVSHQLNSYHLIVLCFDLECSQSLLNCYKYIESLMRYYKNFKDSNQRKKKETIKKVNKRIDEESGDEDSLNKLSGEYKIEDQKIKEQQPEEKDIQQKQKFQTDQNNDDCNNNNQKQDNQNFETQEIQEDEQKEQIQCDKDQNQNKIGQKHEISEEKYLKSNQELQNNEEVKKEIDNLDKIQIEKSKSEQKNKDTLEDKKYQTDKVLEDDDFEEQEQIFKNVILIGIQKSQKFSISQFKKQKAKNSLNGFSKEIQENTIKEIQENLQNATEKTHIILNQLLEKFPMLSIAYYKSDNINNEQKNCQKNNIQSLLNNQSVIFNKSQQNSDLQGIFQNKETDFEQKTNEKSSHYEQNSFLQYQKQIQFGNSLEQDYLLSILDPVFIKAIDNCEISTQH